MVEVRMIHFGDKEIVSSTGAYVTLLSMRNTRSRTMCSVAFTLAELRSFADYVDTVCDDMENAVASNMEKREVSNVS